MNIRYKANRWLQDNATLYRGDNASDCMIKAYIEGANAMVKSILKGRSNEYGDFSTLSSTAAELKDCIRVNLGWDKLPSDAKESLDMILHKVARIVNKAHRSLDQWQDIEGYAKLISDRIQKEVTCE